MNTVGKLLVFLVISMVVLGIVGAFFKFLLKWALIAVVLLGLARFVVPELLRKN